MTKVWLLPIVIVLHLAGPRGGGAQTLAVDGTVRDSVTARAVPRVSVCYDWKTSPVARRCTQSDSTGAFHLDSLPANSGSVYASCFPLRGFGRLQFSRKYLRPPSDSLHLVIGTEGCDMRLERRVRGIFAGHYSSGFEQSELVPCPRFGWYIASDTIGVRDAFRRNAWMTWPQGRATPGRPKSWPKARPVHPPWNYPEYYIRFRGTVIGPGSYGHLGVAGFEAVVDSVIEVRTPAEGDCERGTR